MGYSHSLMMCPVFLSSIKQNKICVCCKSFYHTRCCPLSGGVCCKGGFQCCYRGTKCRSFNGFNFVCVGRFAGVEDGSLASPQEAKPSYSTVRLEPEDPAVEGDHARFFFNPLRNTDV
ncbi:hypothetical protein JTE90_000663 [Oedothorax gibbosus]|uniref:Granulins domain-containing protein n=1 Tax=Oedothorax gibbosus TaxID=931172 RepID=A0AAV6VV27_9ARAC|nr:hypothetical protein JTE90_000663 [Oedothorax gibbosus]